MRKTIVSVGYAIRHPFKAADLALWERRNRRDIRRHTGEDYARESDARRVLAVLERDGGGMFNVADIMDSLHGTMTRTRVLAALELLIGRGEAFCTEENLPHGGAGQRWNTSWITYGATEFNEERRDGP